MAQIRERHERHFIDDCGQMFWINGPENFCYLSERVNGVLALVFFK